MRQSARSPTACQKVISRQPKSDGSSQFHRCSTISPPMKTKTSIPRIASGTMKISFINLLAMLSPSRFRKVIVNPLQPLTQMEHRVAFARKQRIYAHAGAGGEFLETQALDFVRDEDFALLRRQLAYRQLECGQEHAAGVERLRAGVGRRQQIFELQRLVVFVRVGRVAEEHRFLLAEEIDDAIAGHAKEPAGDVVD